MLPKAVANRCELLTVGRTNLGKNCYFCSFKLKNNYCMEHFIELHRVKVSVNNDPTFDPILVNLQHIVAVERSVHKGCGADVYLNLQEDEMLFHPLRCRESYKDILALLKEKGIVPTSL
jgi:hypothetical protein